MKSGIAENTWLNHTIKRIWIVGYFYLYLRDYYHFQYVLQINIGIYYSVTHVYTFDLAVFIQCSVQENDLKVADLKILAKWYINFTL